MKCFPKSGRFIIVLILMINASNGFAQNSLLFMSDITGNPLEAKKSMNINGTPYYPENYTTATIYLKGGGRIENLMSKIYLPDYAILYLASNKVEMVAVSIIEKIEFFPGANNPQPTKEKITFQLLPSSTNANSAKKYFQVIDTGKINLLKLYTSEFTEGKEFGSATITRNYDQKTGLYAYSIPKGLIKIKSAEQLLTNIFSDEKDKVSEFIVKNKINIKKEKEVKKLFVYYNSL